MDNGATMHLAVSLFPGTADPSPEPEFDRLARFAQKAEAAGLDMVLLADAAPASSSDAANRQVPFEATTLLAALATVTSRIGLVAMASTVAHQPYNLARRFVSLDIISHGRAGWNATMAQAPREAANFSRPEGFSPDDFRRRTEEYIGIVHGLHAKRHPVDTGRPVAAEAFSLDAGWIGLQRDLDMRVHRPVPADGIQDGADGGGLHERWRAAAEEDGGDGALRREFGAMGDLRGEGRNETGLIHRRMADMAVEVAIGAFRGAERPVHIDTEARVRCWMHHGPCFAAKRASAQGR